LTGAAQSFIWIGVAVGFGNEIGRCGGRPISFSAQSAANMFHINIPIKNSGLKIGPAWSASVLSETLLGGERR
jgi:hypothetical protein